MRLFHTLQEQDKHNAIHYCLHIIVEDFLDDGVEFEPISDEDKHLKLALENVLIEAQAIEDTHAQFEFIVHHEDVSGMIFDMALDMARSSYYADNTEMVIHYEDLRWEEGTEATEEIEPHDILSVEELNAPAKKNSALN